MTSSFQMCYNDNESMKTIIVEIIKIAITQGDDVIILIFPGQYKWNWLLYKEVEEFKKKKKKHKYSLWNLFQYWINEPIIYEFESC